MASETASRAAPSHGHTTAYMSQAEASAAYAHRKALPIKRGDSEPLTREDIQYDLLYYIFADNTAAFTDPTAVDPSAKITFAQLYVNALFNSNKCSKVLKDKMMETPAFALEFAKICLLTNVGRINTTMAFFPEMKTALRSYHPVPSLQKTDGNAQDAPRIKNCLKAALLPSEFKTVPPSSPAEILARAQSGQIPPTSVVNLIFVLSNHASTLPHFDSPTDFVDLFLPVPLSSPSRAKAFLWLMHHYLEGSSSPNPFADDHARANPDKVPQLRRLTRAEFQKENVDPPEEVEWGKTMAHRRSLFLQKLVGANDPERKGSHPGPPEQPVPPPPKGRDHRRHRVAHPAVYQASRGETFLHYKPKDDSGNRHSRRGSNPRIPVQTYDASNHVPEPARSMLEQAWYSIRTMDALADSDEEIFPDENVRLDLQRRLNVMTRLRGRSPTPPQPSSATRGTFASAHHADREASRAGKSATFTGRFQRAEWD